MVPGFWRCPRSGPPWLTAGPSSGWAVPRHLAGARRTWYALELRGALNWEGELAWAVKVTEEYAAWVHGTD